MQSLETQLVQRAYDGKWEKVVQTFDHENKYYYTDEDGKKAVLIPTKWVTVAVYDALMEIV